MPEFRKVINVTPVRLEGMRATAGRLPVITKPLSGGQQSQRETLWTLTSSCDAYFSCFAQRRITVKRPLTVRGVATTSDSGRVLPPWLVISLSQRPS